MLLKVGAEINDLDKEIRQSLVKMHKDLGKMADHSTQNRLFRDKGRVMILNQAEIHGEMVYQSSNTDDIYLSLDGLEHISI